MSHRDPHTRLQGIQGTLTATSEESKGPSHQPPEELKGLSYSQGITFHDQAGSPCLLLQHQLQQDSPCLATEPPPALHLHSHSKSP